MDEALEMLEKSYQERHPSLVSHYYPMFEPFRSEPRFGDILRRMKLADPAAPGRTAAR